MAIPLPNGITSNRDPTSMQLLGYTTAQKLLYDFANSGNFYILLLTNVSPWSPGFSLGFGAYVLAGTIICVSAQTAAAWFAQNGLPTIVVYNPFLLNKFPLSNVITDP
jgi:hypothetical protein